MGGLSSKREAGGSLTSFQRKKLRYDFRTFFDLNKDGCLTYKDFLWAKDKICQMSGWEVGSRRYVDTESLFREIWASLEEIGDIDKDGEISEDEWLTMWETYLKDIAIQEEQEHKLRRSKSNKDRNANVLSLSSASIIHELHKDIESDEQDQEKTEDFDPDLDDESRWTDFLQETKLPLWLYKYFLFRFNLLDRTGDNVIDSEEFVYVLAEFGVKERNAKQAYIIFSKNNTMELDFDYFVHLCAEYYLSDDPSDLGNFINGKLDYDYDSTDEEPPEKPQVCRSDSIRNLEIPREVKLGANKEFTRLKKQKCCLTS